MATVEWCLCEAAGERPVSARSVQQLLECTDGLAIDEGTRLERANTYCVGGFPAVHMDYIIRSVLCETFNYYYFFSGLNGTLDSAEQLPEIDPTEFEQQFCDDFVNDTTVARVTSYISDIFTTENHLNISVGLIGPTTTNIAVTPMIAFYGGGVYYNEAECTNYAEEEVPIQCQEERAGILSFTCLTKVSHSPQ